MYNLYSLLKISVSLQVALNYSENSQNTLSIRTNFLWAIGALLYSSLLIIPVDPPVPSLTPRKETDRLSTHIRELNSSRSSRPQETWTVTKLYANKELPIYLPCNSVGKFEKRQTLLIFTSNMLIITKYFSIAVRHQFWKLTTLKL